MNTTPEEKAVNMRYIVQSRRKPRGETYWRPTDAYWSDQFESTNLAAIREAIKDLNTEIYEVRVLETTRVWTVSPSPPSRNSDGDDDDDVANQLVRES